MKKLLVKILTKFIELRAKWRGNLYNFRRAVKKAEHLAKGNGHQKGKRTYVYFIGGKYRAFNRKDVQALRNAGVFKANINTQSLAKICLYDTQTKVNSHPQFKKAKL